MKRENTLDLRSTFLRLRPDASMEKLPVDDSFWQRLSAGELGDFHHEYLVTTFTFESDWPTWEIHPNGDEIVCLLSGAATLVLEGPDGETGVDLRAPGEFAFVPRGTWHTARTERTAVMLFVTAGEGTRHRPV